MPVKPPLITNVIRSLREAHGQTQEELGEAIGVTRQTVISIESGRYNPSLPLAFLIANHFARPIEEIFHAVFDIQPRR